MLGTKLGGWTVACALLMPWAAAAQDNGLPPRVSVGGSAGIALPFHGDFDFTPWAWDADVRFALSPHALFEVAVGDWRHSERTTRENLPVQGPSGPIGSIARYEETTTRVQRSVQANLLFTGAAGRVRVNGGGGGGLMTHERSTRSVTEGCSPQVSCGESHFAFSSISAAFQAVGGTDLQLSRQVALYGQVRLLVPMRDAGSSDVRLTTGVRVGFGS